MDGRSSTSSTFGHYGKTDTIPGQWYTALFTSSAMYVALAFGLAAAGVGVTKKMTEKPVDVTFVETVLKETPPPVPTPIAQPTPPPVVPKGMKVRQAKKTLQEALSAPKHMPTEVPLEADPSLDKGIEVWLPDDSQLASGIRKIGGRQEEITEQLEGVKRARPFSSNQPPPYPKTARNAGKEASVTLKIRITLNGRVEDIQVVDGEEPFTSAAVRTVEKWRYKPATYNGKPITVYRIIKIGFQLYT